MKKKGIRSKRLVNVVVMALLLTMTSWLLPVDFMMAESEAATQLGNPVIVEDNSIYTGQRVTWDCIWFGSYPQSEVVCETDTERISELTNGYYNNKYVTVSNSTWSKITSAEYNNNGDATVNGVKYRRLKKTDANNVASEDSDYYNWGDETVHYFEYEPIKWRVLKVEGNDAFLVAEKALDCQRYNLSYTSITWEKCTMRSWLNGYNSSSNSYGRDYTNKNFIDTAFSSSEKNIIKMTDVHNYANKYYSSDTEGGNDTSDSIFLLSQSEVDGSIYYGFTESGVLGIYCHGTTYANAMGIYSNVSSNSYASNCEWWLRSPGFANYRAATVNYDGAVGYGNGESVDETCIAVRPALHLNISSSALWSYAGTVLGHTCTWTDGSITTKPTCTEKGVKTYTCTSANCDKTKTEKVAALGHTEVIDKAVAATYTSTGLTEGKHCSVCGKVLIAQKEIPALTNTETSVKTNTINGASSFNKTYGDSTFSLNATAKTTLSYSSSDTDIATVSSGGVVTIKSAGTVTINIKAAATSSYTAASKQVTIYISKASQNITCAVKNTVNKSFGASAFSLGAKSKTGRTYTTSNSNIAKVSSDGKVTLKNPGKAVITITAKEGTNYKKATKKITVNVALKKPSLTVKTKKTNGKRKATLTWTKPYGAQGYELYTYVPSAKSGKKTYIKSGNKKSATVSGFKKKTTYKYKIRAYRTVNGKKVYSPYTSYKKIYFSK